MEHYKYKIKKKRKQKKRLIIKIKAKFLGLDKEVLTKTIIDYH